MSGDIAGDLPETSAVDALGWLARAVYTLVAIFIPGLIAAVLYSQISSGVAANNILPLVTAIAVSLAYWSAGWILLVRRFDQPIARIFFWMAQLVGIACLPPLAYPQPLPIPAWITPFDAARFQLLAPVFFHYCLTFPVRLGSSRQRRWVILPAYLLGILTAACRVAGLDQPHLITGSYATLVTLVAIGVSIYVYARRSTPHDRQRLRLVIFGLALTVTPAVIFYFIARALHSAYQMPEWLAGLLMIVSPLTYVYAFTQHHLFGIDRLLNRTLVYLVLSAGILFIYILPLVVLYKLLPGEWFVQVLVVALLTMLVGWNFAWLRVRVERAVDRIFYGGWYTYPGVIDTISAALARCLDRQQVTEVLTRRVPALMRFQDGVLAFGDEFEEQPETVHLPYLAYPFTLQGGLKACWWVSGHPSGEDFSTADRWILKTLAEQAEIALNNVVLVEALRAQLEEIRSSRETLAQIERELLRSREQERSRLARDLHDGPIQTLIGLNLQMGMLASEGSPAGPAVSPSPIQQSIEEMRIEVRGLLTELRQTCAELRPPMLDMLGLDAAIRALAGEWAKQHGVAVRMDIAPEGNLGPIPDEVSLNLYHVVQEALANVARHAAAQTVIISFQHTPGRLALTIEDDGLGFDPDKTLPSATAYGHFGLAGMRERISLIGGNIDLLSAPGKGTRISITWKTSSSKDLAPRLSL
jgi:signal transduction histidine kinase